MKLIKYGVTTYLVLNKVELEAQGHSVNPHMYLGDGQIFCIICGHYTLHYGMSLPSRDNNPFTPGNKEVCSNCNNYYEPTINLNQSVIDILNKG